MAKFVFNGQIGFGFGAASANSKKGWIGKIISKMTGKTQQQPTEQPETKTTEEAAGGIGGYGLQYSGSIELSLEEMRELYSLTHSDEEWSFGRSAAELKAIGKGVKDLADKFVADNGDSIKAVWNTACGVYESCKRRDYESTKVDREIRLNETKDRYEFERAEDRLRREDARIRREEAEKEEKAKK
jgi:hypothetical protein